MAFISEQPKNQFPNMSLPIPSVSPHYPSASNKAALDALDAPLIALTQRCNGDLRQLLTAFFSFLHRRTDFYMVPHPSDTSSKMGFREGDAEKVLVAAFRQYPLRKMPSQAQMAKASAVNTMATSTQPVSEKETAVKEEPQTKKVEANSETLKDAGASTKDVVASTTPTDDGVRYTEEGLQIPVGNGGSTARYKWTQTLEETSVLVAVGMDRKAKQLDVTIKSDRVMVNEKEGAHCFVEGVLTHPVVPSESTWTLEGGVLILALHKKQPLFWETVVEGDDKIDTELVDSRRHIEEYDESTQAQLRRLIFDQSQERRGLPKSHEILGESNKQVPDLPTGVEFIDQKVLDEAAKQT